MIAIAKEATHLTIRVLAKTYSAYISINIGKCEEIKRSQREREM